MNGHEVQDGASTGDALTSAEDGRRIRGVLALGGVPLHDLDDALQTVRLRVLEHQAAADQPKLRNPRAWAAVTASRIAVDWHRERARQSELRERLAAQLSARGAEVAGPADRTTGLLALAGALDRLSAEHRQVVVLRFYCDLRLCDVAAVLNERTDGHREEPPAHRPPAPAHTAERGPGTAMIRTPNSRLRRDLAALGDLLASDDGTDVTRLARGGTKIPGSARGVASTRLTQGRAGPAVALAAAAAFCLLVVVVVLDAARQDPPTDASQALTDPELVACSDGIGVGTITRMEDTKRAWEVRLTLAMEEWLKPAANAGDAFSFVTASAAERGERPFRVGERVLFVLQEAVSNHLVYRELRDPTDPVSAQRKSEEFRQSLRRDADTPCPSFWGQ